MTESPLDTWIPVFPRAYDRLENEIFVVELLPEN